MEKQESLYFLYVIKCNFKDLNFIKIGKSRSLKSRISNIQTGCPFRISKIFTISSEYEDEINGIEKYLHYRFQEYCSNGEWYDANGYFIIDFLNEFERINNGDFSWDEIDYISDEIHFDSLEILLHSHKYIFKTVNKVKGNLIYRELKDFSTFYEELIAGKSTFY
ncbi:MAG: GIY-YIG nuclease family protein [Spirochaetales bacterium]|nr:GIY-YIG nuclease family protein [Spirochaetales bacterium]